MPSGDEQSDQPRQGELARPLSITVASWIWFIWGCLFLLVTAVSLIRCAFGGVRLSAKMSAISMLETVALMAAIGAIFLYGGVQALRGRARDMSGNGIATLLFGLCSLAMDFKYFSGRRAPVSGLICSTSLVVAGVLALVGRRQYLAWRQSLNANQAAKKGT